MIDIQNYDIYIQKLLINVYRIYIPSKTRNTCRALQQRHYGTFNGCKWTFLTRSLKRKEIMKS